MTTQKTPQNIKILITEDDDGHAELIRDLLLEVGLELSLPELRSVGKSSLLVATIGVITPVAMGVFVGLAFGESSNTALFLGTALAATSVGITARVFHSAF